MWEGRMFKQAKDLKEGDVVIDRGRRFTVKRIIVNPDTGMISVINTDDSWHGEYHPEEYLGVVARVGIQPERENLCQAHTHRIARVFAAARKSWNPSYRLGGTSNVSGVLTASASAITTRGRAGFAGHRSRI
jgi:hypothetical protein